MPCFCLSAAIQFAKALLGSFLTLNSNVCKWSYCGCVCASLSCSVCIFCIIVCPHARLFVCGWFYCVVVIPTKWVCVSVIGVVVVVLSDCWMKWWERKIFRAGNDHNNRHQSTKHTPAHISDRFGLCDRGKKIRRLPLRLRRRRRQRPTTTAVRSHSGILQSNIHESEPTHTREKKRAISWRPKSSFLTFSALSRGSFYVAFLSFECLCVCYPNFVSVQFILFTSARNDFFCIRFTVNLHLIERTVRYLPDFFLSKVIK